jgi:hypothetical protein
LEVEQIQAVELLETPEHGKLVVLGYERGHLCVTLILVHVQLAAEQAGIG